MEWSKLDESTITELEKLLAAEPCSGAGVILRLAWRAGLSPRPRCADGRGSYALSAAMADPLRAIQFLCHR